MVCRKFLVNHKLISLWYHVVKCVQELAYLMYNDHPPHGSKAKSQGHTKGESTTKFVIYCCQFCPLFLLPVMLTLCALQMLVLLLLPAGCREAANCRYCFYSQAKNEVFCPAGATRCTDSGQTLQDRRAPGSAWPCKISHQSAQGGRNAAPKISKISTFW